MPSCSSGYKINWGRKLSGRKWSVDAKWQSCVCSQSRGHSEPSAKIKSRHTQQNIPAIKYSSAKMVKQIGYCFKLQVGTFIKGGGEFPCRKKIPELTNGPLRFPPITLDRGFFLQKAKYKRHIERGCAKMNANINKEIQIYA